MQKTIYCCDGCKEVLVDGEEIKNTHFHIEGRIAVSKWIERRWSEYNITPFANTHWHRSCLVKRIGETE